MAGVIAILLLPLVVQLASKVLAWLFTISLDITINVITPHACARGKVIGLSVVCRLLSTQKSPDLKIQASLWSISTIKQSKVTKNCLPSAS